MIGSVGAAGEGALGSWYLSDYAGVGLTWSKCDCANAEARYIHAPRALNALSWVLKPDLAPWKGIMLCIKLQPALGIQSPSALDHLTNCIPKCHSKTLTIGLARVLTNQIQNAEEGAPQATGGLCLGAL